MKKGSLALLLAGVAALLVVWFRSSSPDLLRDSDTAVLLDALRQRGNPFSWFWGDWPLQNHFYRPVSTLFFELDLAVYGDRVAGYGWTNALLAGGCVLLCWWTTSKWTKSTATGVLASWLLALWLLPLRLDLQVAMGWAALVVLFVSGFRQSRLGPGVLAAAGLWLVGQEVIGQVNLHQRIVDWLPGRTASVMTLFGLLALGSFVVAQRQQLVLRPASAFDVPATKSTQPTSLHDTRWLIVVATAALLAALGSYEQAITIPVLMLGAWQLLKSEWTFGVGRWIRRISPSGWLVPVGCLVGYILVRFAVVPMETSGYQAQQFRNGPGVWLAILDYFLPGLRSIESAYIFATSGPTPYLLTDFYTELISGLSGTILFVYLAIRYRDDHGFWLWPASVIAFLPMAWLKPFEHYHLFPMALRAGFVAWLMVKVAGWVATAVSPRPRQAPPRSYPAPGSLPHR